MNKYHKKITDYMMKRPRVFVKMSKVRKDLKASHSDDYHRAMQDLIAGGRLECYPDGSIRINQ